MDFIEKRLLSLLLLGLTLVLIYKPVLLGGCCSFYCYNDDDYDDDDDGKDDGNGNGNGNGNADDNDDAMNSDSNDDSTFCDATITSTNVS